jgi:hypothetical protein
MAAGSIPSGVGRAIKMRNNKGPSTRPAVDRIMFPETGFKPDAIISIPEHFVEYQVWYT